MTQSKILSKECKFVHYTESNQRPSYDMHLIKENVFYEDGTVLPNVKLIENYKRPFYVTKKGLRVHKQKREFEDIDNLSMLYSTQVDLAKNASKALGFSSFQGRMRDLQKSPYLYGTDILTTSLIKRKYKDQFNKFTRYTVAGFDTETDEVNGTKTVTIASLTMGSKVFTAIRKDYLTGISDPVNKILDKANELIKEEIDTRKIKFEIMVVDKEIDIFIECFKRAHEWKPDFISIWNMEFDITKLVQACETSGVSPADILSDPIVPKEYRNFKFTIGPAKRITADKKLISFTPEKRWHTVDCLSSFYIVDSMCAFRQVRQGEPEENNYKLDTILKKYLGKTKLKLDAADHLSELDWHIFMQKNYPIEYIIYNQIDCIRLEMLDEKTKDLSYSLPVLASESDYRHFSSQPRRNVDKAHYFALENNCVISCASGDIEDDLDEMKTSLSGWVVMLPAHNVAENGLAIVEELPNEKTNIYTHVSDLDIKGSYPHNTIVANVSRGTTVNEILSVENIPEEVVRINTLNFSGGKVNSMAWCQNMLGMPSHDDMLAAFDNEYKKAA